MKYIALFLALGLFLGSCSKKTTTVDQAALDQQTISTYIANNSISNTQTTSTGIRYTIDSPGLGNSPALNSNFTISYKGYLTDGTVFAQSPPNGNTFNLALVISGLQQTIPLFKKGGKGKIIIPSSYGYGIQANGAIPANAVLIFDIELLNVQ